MGFKIEYLSDGTVKASLNLKGEDIDSRCPTAKLPEPPQENLTQNKSIAEERKIVPQPQEAT
jgi:hypothetical protein